jgi:protein tyrosine phosphatase (PTP) superfamily phosphohydrolase (DUF442 family)
MIPMRKLAPAISLLLALAGCPATAPVVPQTAPAPRQHRWPNSTKFTGDGALVYNLAWVVPNKLLRSGARVTGGRWAKTGDDEAVLKAYRGMQNRYPLSAVVNLRAEASEDAKAAESLGMAYLHLPIEDGHAPTPDQVTQFFAFLKQQEGVTLWHCAAGVGRTGIFAGMLRLKDGWTTQAAAQEMFNMGLGYDAAAEHLPALNNFAQALGQPAYYPADWTGPRTAPYDYQAVAPAVPVIDP